MPGIATAARDTWTRTQSTLRLTPDVDLAPADRDIATVSGVKRSPTCDRARRMKSCRGWPAPRVGFPVPCEPHGNRWNGHLRPGARFHHATALGCMSADLSRIRGPDVQARLGRIGCEGRARFPVWDLNGGVRFRACKGASVVALFGDCTLCGMEDASRMCGRAASTGGGSLLMGSGSKDGLLDPMFTLGGAWVREICLG